MYNNGNILLAVLGEKKFYKKLSLLNNEYIVIPQVNLASIIEKRSNVRFHNELFRNIDFGIFDKETMEVLLLIEVNDRTHAYSSRKKRDRSVREICLNADIPLITFYTTYPNETDYVLNRIRKEIHSRQENQETHQTTVLNIYPLPSFLDAIRRQEKTF